MSKSRPESPQDQSFSPVDWGVYQATRWDQLPDLGLYMDQVITYVEQQCRSLYGPEKFLTPAMVNNYVKSGLVLRPMGKKYDRLQLAQLIMICTLKQAFSMDEMSRLLTPSKPVHATFQDLYQDFCTTQNTVWSMVQARRSQDSTVFFALEAAASKIMCGEKLAAAASSQS